MLEINRRTMEGNTPKRKQKNGNTSKINEYITVLCRLYTDPDDKGHFDGGRPCLILKYFESDPDRIYLENMDTEVCKVYYVNKENIKRVFEELVNYLNDIEGHFFESDRFYIEDDNNPKCLYPSIPGIYSKFR